MELVLKQTQNLNLKMTYELRQAIELLQYSTYELYQFIREKELENPLIELEDSPVDFGISRKSNSTSVDSHKSSMELIRTKETSMREKLIEHSLLLAEDSRQQSLLKYLIHNLDDNGYLLISEDMALNYSYTEAEINEGIHLLQAIVPAGTGARNLKECLLLQITEDFSEAALATCLIENHLELLANRKWEAIASLMDISLAKVKEIHDYILTFNPKPCCFISDFSVAYINPDIVIETDGDAISFYLNDSYLPAIYFNDEYSSLFSGKDKTAKYLKTQFSNYQWLLSSIEQRRQTLIKIVAVVIEKQKSFFTEGFVSLKPLTLKEIANEIGMHESTISRATSNKVIQTPKGAFELRIFFTSKLDSADGSCVSQTKVKTLLKELIENENKFKPLSDQKIADFFSEKEGIPISRRTVTKYRKELNIPSSSRRKDIMV